MSSETEHPRGRVELDDPGADGAGDGADGGDGVRDPLADRRAAEPSRGGGPADEAAVERLLAFLKESRSFDFTGYKRPSLVRRIRHRMAEVGIDSVDEYQDRLQLQPGEFTALFNTILINVTSFFRDEEAWTYLADRVLPDVLAASAGGPIRVWSAGCASGQEAYSIAMLLHEVLGRHAYGERVKIYATDIDEEALETARQAAYGERELRGLPEEYRHRYFEPAGKRWVLAPDLRRSVTFGRNDLTQDAPISRIDVLLCRNTLMYFNAETQARVVSRLGFALRPQGVLFLGKAEMLLNHAAVFEPVDLRRRFFRKIRSEVPAASLTTQPWRLYGREASLLEGQLRNELIMSNPAAQLAVGVDGRLLMVNHRAAAMLGLSDRDVGRPFAELEFSYRPVELRSQLLAVTEGRSMVSLREVEWRRGGLEPAYLDVQLVPLVDGTGRMLGASITLTDVTRYRELQLEVERTNRQLETAYEELQSTNEELETTNEELQSTVEELETTNEELQSTNEELETMNSELQATNDEVQIANDTLRDRSLVINELNGFMQSILDSLDAAVIVVSSDLVIQAWSRQAEELWGLREQETIGQHLLALDSGLPVPQLHPWLRSVLSGQETGVYGRHVQAVNRRGRTVELRITVTAMNREAATTGALMLFEEVSARE